MIGYRNRFILLTLQNAPILLFAVLIIIFGLMSARFLTPVNFVNIFNKAILTFGRTAYLGIPSAIWIFAIVLVVAVVVLKLTTFGRQVYAVGADPDAAAKAGIHVKGVIFSVYCICGVCAAVGGLVSA